MRIELNCLACVPAVVLMACTADDVSNAPGQRVRTEAPVGSQLANSTESRGLETELTIPWPTSALTVVLVSVLPSERTVQVRGSEALTARVDSTSRVAALFYSRSPSALGLAEGTLTPSDEGRPLPRPDQILRLEPGVNAEWTDGVLDTELQSIRVPRGLCAGCGTEPERSGRGPVDAGLGGS